jgi:integrase
MRKTLTDAGIRALKPRAARYAHPDPELAGHYVRVQPSSAKSFVAVTRGPGGKQVWTTIGPVDLISVDEAREKARAAIKRVQAGKPALEILAKAETFGDVVAEWRTRHLERNGLRAAREINRLLNVHILPAWGARELVSIRRSDVAALLDLVEDRHGGRSADYCLTIARAIMNWHAARRDDYAPPIVRGMRRQSTHAQARTRLLDDGEIRRIWIVCERLGTYGALIRMLLLTTQRLDKVLTMAWADIDADGVWRIPNVSKREKPHGRELKLPQLARDLLAASPVLEGNPYVFAGRGQDHINGHSKNKARLDKASGVTGWVVHDLRRTARSLLSRAGVRPDIAERTLGHIQPGVANVYDRHAYFDEKADALAKLAALVERIVHNPSGTVVPLGGKRR